MEITFYKDQELKACFYFNTLDKNSDKINWMAEDNVFKSSYKDVNDGEDMKYVTIAGYVNVIALLF